MHITYKLLERYGAEYYETKNQFVCKVKQARDSTNIMLELRPRKAASLIAFLAAFLSSVAAKTEAGKKTTKWITLLLLCAVEHLFRQLLLA